MNIEDLRAAIIDYLGSGAVVLDNNAMLAFISEVQDGSPERVLEIAEFLNII